jgi:hypothetical protein
MPQDVPAKRFFMNGDEWGLYDVLPAENLAHCLRVAEAYRAHHKDTVFAPTGWMTPPYVIPQPEVAISSRGIRVGDLESIIGTVMPKAAGVDSCLDFTGKPFPSPNCFAFALSLDSYWQCEGFYGSQQEQIVQALHVTECLRATRTQSHAIVDAIVQVGRRFDLILLANADRIIDLRDPDEVAAFIELENGSENP